MSEQPPPIPITVPQIVHTPSPKPPPSPTSSTCSSTATEDISDSGEDSPAAMEPSELDYLTHGDLRSPGREFARERSLRKKAPRHASSSSIHSPATLGTQPEYPSDDEEEKRKNMTPEERTKARKKAKKAAKADKRKALKSQESVKIPRKREDRRREDEVAAVEASMAALLTTPETNTVTSNTNEDGEQQRGDVANTPDRQRRRSSNTLTRPAKPRKTSSSNQGTSGGGAAATAAAKSPKIGVEADADALNKRSVAPHGNAKHQAAFRQYHVEEGIHERSNDIDSQMAALAQFEAMRELSRGGKLARGLEELEKRKMERKRDEALKGVVEAAQEKYEDEKLARLYGLK
ncbi:hypothetical protein ABW20_dc0107402 [Dactylellina cionopaga]|nr:hypothetical protein ABW20_dc0107402 [Dactylellina cionopaga]